MRSLDDHLSPEELTRLPEDLELLEREGADQPLLRHLKECRACAELAQAHGKLRELGLRASAEEGSCPAGEVWLELAEGLCPEHAEQLLRHASKCSACAQLLKEATELMQPHELEEPLPGLQSSTQAWRVEVASKLAAQNDRPAGDRQRGGMLRWFKSSKPWAIPSLAMVSCVLIAVAGFLVWHSQNPSESRLLALSYNQQRRIPLRIPGADPVPMVSETRGSSGLADPVPLLELKARAEVHLNKSPNDPYWNQVLGEAYLLEPDGSTAFRYIEKAFNADAALPNILADRAAARFEMAEQSEEIENESGKPQEVRELYGEAIDFYAQALKARPGDPALLYYNRALCYEQISAYENALEDLHSALGQEKSPRWRAAIQAEIARLTGRSSVGVNGSAAATGVQAQPVANYEDQLSEATGELLPLWSSDPSARERVARITRDGPEHHDRWLEDWVAAGHTGASENGDRQLAAAVRDASAGDEESSLRESRGALAAYRVTGNAPGRVRAELAETYAMQRLGQAKECLAEAQTLEREPRIRDYSWVYTQLTLEEAICRFLSGDYDSARRDYDKALLASVHSKLDWLHLRAMAGQAEILDFRGSPRGAWEIDSEALRLCTQLQCPPIRKYAFLYDMVNSAEELHLKYTALELMRAGVDVARASGDATTYAYALENLAILAGRAGDYTASNQAFAEALKVTSSGTPIRSVAIYRAEWQTDRAEILLRHGAAQAALELLRRDQAALLASDYHHGRLHFFSDMALACLAIGDIGGARSNAVAAVGEVDSTLRTLHSINEKEQWQRQNAPEYMQLVKVYLGLNDSQKAFEVWENYRALAYETTGTSGNRAWPQAPSSLNDGKSVPEQTVLVLAEIDDGYVGWVVASRSLRVLQTEALGHSDQIHPMVASFYRMCSDPDAPLSDIRTLGARLYTALFKPFGVRMTSGGQLWLDVDSSLAYLPVAALTTGGKWLAEASTVKILPAWWTVHPEVFTDDAPVQKSGRFVVVNGFTRAENDYSEALAVAGLFSHSVLLDGAATAHQALVADLSTAEVFHFSGHALVETGSSYLVAGDTDGRRRLLDAQSLGSVRMQHCRIAVLAACNTTASNPERVEPPADLRNAFLRAGAHGVIASYWDVDDRSTGVLMIEFYRQLAAGLPPAQSLEHAELAVCSQTSWQHPYYWASFQFFVN